MSTLMTHVTYGQFFQATYAKELPAEYRVNVEHWPYLEIDGKVVLSSWDDIAPIIDSEGKCDCLCRIHLAKQVDGTEFFEDVAEIPVVNPVIDTEYADELSEKVQTLLDIATQVATGSIETEDAKTEVDVIASTLVKTIATPEPI